MSLRQERDMSYEQNNMNVGADMRDLTKGPVTKEILLFALPIFAGQLLQFMYNLADAWVIGNYADNDAFAAVSTMGIIVVLIVGFCNGLAVGGSVIISRHFGAGEQEKVSRAIHSNYLLAFFISIGATVLGLILVPHVLRWIDTPRSVMPYAARYLQIYFAGISTMVFYNIAMSVMRALGDSLHPLYYLTLSSGLNIVLDLIFVAHPAFRWGVTGAAAATVISQGISATLCISRQVRRNDFAALRLSKIHLYPGVMAELVRLGLPSGLQTALLSIGNLAVQKNINAFGTYAMSGFGAYARLEALVFLPIMAMSLSLPTFISQNLGAAKYDRVRKGALFGLLFGMASAQLVGISLYFYAPRLLRFFTTESQALEYGIIHSRIVPPFFFLLAFAHCSAGILRGCGKAIIPMLNMFLFWCLGRILYVSLAVRIWPRFQTISAAYPIVWALSDLVFLYFLYREFLSGRTPGEETFHDA